MPRTMKLVGTEPRLMEKRKEEENIIVVSTVEVRTFDFFFLLSISAIFFPPPLSDAVWVFLIWHQRLCVWAEKREREAVSGEIFSCFPPTFLLPPLTKSLLFHSFFCSDKSFLLSFSLSGLFFLFSTSSVAFFKPLSSSSSSSNPGE